MNPIGSLEAGKTYVIKTDARSVEDLERLKEDLRIAVPECKFLVLGRGVELLTSLPVVEEAACR